jgi:hypothetical protein
MASEDERRVGDHEDQGERGLHVGRHHLRPRGLDPGQIWFFTTRDCVDAFFWPIFPPLAMGLASTAQWGNVCHRKPVTDGGPRREMDDDG